MTWTRKLNQNTLNSVTENDLDNTIKQNTLSVLNKGNKFYHRVLTMA